MKKTFVLTALFCTAAAFAAEPQHNHPAQNGHVHEYHATMADMHNDMMNGISAADPDTAFAAGMLPHHQGAVKMAEIELKYGKDPVMRKLAEDIIQAQQAEIELMQSWLKRQSEKAAK